MEQKTLKYLRILIPGLIILLGLVPYKPEIEKFIGTAIVINDYFIVVFALLFGAIYYQFNIQRIITKTSHNLIVRNIFTRIIKMRSKEDDVEVLWAIKKNRGKIMREFYKIIDNEESLKKKQLNIYFNGIFWSSSADLFLISLVYFALYISKILNVDNIGNLPYVFLILSIFSLLLHFISIKKHINLSNEQLSHIEENKLYEVK